MPRMRTVVYALAGAMLAIQLVPYGREHDNPKITGQPDWDRAQTRELFFRTCKNCHSNETEWPWYSAVAPVSWLVQYDVEEGRSHFNVSEWGRPKNHGDEATEAVREGEMPPWFYVPTHPEARLSDAERDQLLVGLAATFGEEDEDEDAADPHGADDRDSHEREHEREH